MGSDNFCLRWNDFEHNINSSLKELRDEKDFFDVTLACEGDDHIQGWRLRAGTPCPARPDAVQVQALRSLVGVLGPRCTDAVV